MSRVPFDIPHGWFSAGYSSEFEPETIASRHYVGRDLIVWRDRDGVAHVQEAHCPHLGAHIGVGGSVEGRGVRCPFHGWAFDAAGVNTDIPYADTVNRKGRLRTFPVVERNGMVMFWYHPDESVEPGWDIPEISEVTDDEVSGSDTLEWVVDTAWQEVAENAFDLAHFMFVHGLTEMGDLGSYSFDGPVRRGKSNQKFNTPQGIFEGTIETSSFGPGFGVTHFHLVGDVYLLSSGTPIAADSYHARFAFVYKDDEISQKIGPLFAKEVERQFEQDLPIWENKVYVSEPALAPGEKPIMEFRRWASQFYGEGSGAATGT